MTPAIRVENLSKCYRVARNQEHGRYRTLRDSIVNTVKAPYRRMMNGGQPTGVEDFWALNDISFEVRPGEVVGIIGRNGAGKSTLLKVLSRITKPTKGRIELDGRVGSLLEVGTGFHPELTGRENIYLNGSILGMSRWDINRRFDEIVAFAEVDEFLDTPVKRYSSGMYVRLAFAVAAHLEPEILIIDEVLAVGDIQFQKKCLGKLKSMNSEGRSILFVSHNMSAVLNLCTRAVWIHLGRVNLDGDPLTISRRYQEASSEAAKSIYDLRECPSRTPGSSPIIQRIAFFDDSGHPLDCLCCGDNVVIRIHLSFPTPVREPQIGIAFDNMLGESIASVATYLSNTPLPDVASDAIVECRIDCIPLIPGDYYLSLSAGHSHHPLMDEISNYVRISVNVSDFYGNGRLPTGNRGKVLLRFRWSTVDA